MVRSIGSWILMMWAVVLFACESARSAPPRITTPVTDNANVLTAAQRSTLSARLAAHRAQTGVQVALLTVASLNGEPIEDFSHRTAVAWGGGSRANNDGVLVTFAVQDHRSRIEVGYGLEAELTDGRTRAMLDGARPFLRRADYAGAFGSILDGIEAQTQARRASTATAFQMAPAERPPQDDTALWWVLLGVGLAVVFLVAVMLRAQARQQEITRQRELDEELEESKRRQRREAERQARLEAARRDQDRLEAARKDQERRDAEDRARAKSEEEPASQNRVPPRASYPTVKSSPAFSVHQAARDAEDARRRRQAAEDAEADRRRRQEQQDAEDARRRRQAAADAEDDRRRSSSSGWISGLSWGSSDFSSSSSSSDSGSSSSSSSSSDSGSSSWGSSDSSSSSSDWSGGGGDFGGGGSSGDW